MMPRAFSGISTKRDSRGCRLLLLCAVLTTLLPARADGASLCVQVEKSGTIWRSVQAAPGSAVRLSFQHSLYGSRVEEIFHILSNGFQLAELRYSEQRLVEFYGHENANFEHSVWVVRAPPATFPALNLRVSSDASMSVLFDKPPQRQQLTVPADTALRLTVAACKDTQDG